MRGRLLWTGLMGLALAGCAGVRGGFDESVLLPAKSEITLSPKATRDVVETVQPALVEAKEASERFGVRNMYGIMRHSNGGGFDPVDSSVINGGVRANRDADNPVLFTDINYTAELDELFLVEAFIGSVIMGDGFRVPMPGQVEDFDSNFELTMRNDLVVIGVSGMVRMGAGRFARFYGGGGLNLYFTDTPGHEEALKVTGMISWNVYSTRNFALNMDAKYWWMGFRDMQYFLIGPNLSWRY